MRPEDGAASRLLPSLFGLIAGGYFARVSLELTARPWPRPVVLVVGLLAAGVGALCVRWLAAAPTYAVADRPALFGWPLALLAPYLVWPQRQPAVAAALAILAALTVLLYRYAQGRRPIISRGVPLSSGEAPSLGSRRLSTGALSNLAIFVISLLFYVATTSRDVLPADSGEFQLVAALLGVAHPPGYPLYTMLGRLFIGLIPFGTQAFRLNLLSAFLAAGTLTLLAAATRHWVRALFRDRGDGLFPLLGGPAPQSVAARPAPQSVAAGLAAALTLGTATTFWSQATVANIRMPTMFAAALALYALANYAQDPRGAGADRFLALLALALGLGVGHHPSLLFFGLFFLIYLFLVYPRLLIQPRRWWRPVLLALLALLPLLYLPLRGAADAPLAPPDLDTWDGFVHHVTAQGFEGDMFAFANSQDLPLRLTLAPNLFLFQFSPALLATAGLGLLLVAWRDRRLLTLLAGGLLLHTFVSITYRAPQTVEYLMPAYLPVAILVGVSSGWLLYLPCGWHGSGTLPRFVATGGRFARLTLLTTTLAAVILLAALTNGRNHAPSYFSLARDRSTRTAMGSLLERAPTDALILADWHWATPLWYLQQVEGQRPDVTVSYVYPIPGQEYADTWRDRVAALVGQRPLLLTHFYDLPGFTLEPIGPGFMIHPRPYRGSPDQLIPLEATFAAKNGMGELRLLGYGLNRLQVRPGQGLEVTLAWQPQGELQQDPSFVVALTTPDGRRLTQDDRFLGSDFVPGEVRFERFVIPLYPDIPPGRYTLAVQVYNAAEVGFETWSLRSTGGAARLDPFTLSLVTLPLQPRSAPPFTLNPLSIPFADGPTLMGVDADRSLPGTLRLYLHWRGPAHGEQVIVGGSVTQLPALSRDAYHTALLDLPGDAQGGLNLALLDTDGTEKTLAGPWGWPLSQGRIPVTTGDARFVPLDDQILLVGVAPERGTIVEIQETLLLRLIFVAQRPLVGDYSVSVRLWDAAGQLRQRHDLQPALGALPTLKWIQGSRVVDPHPVFVPSDVPEGGVTASAVVYDGFRGTPLPPLDGRMGEVPLGEWVLSRRP